MTEMPPRFAGHIVNIRLQPARLVNGMVRGDYTGKWEVICTFCGDDPSLDYASSPPDIQRLRGPYDASEEAKAWADWHSNLNTKGVYNLLEDLGLS